MIDEREEKRKVLLVEDNMELLQVLKEIFSPLYQVVTAANGEEGLKQVFAEVPDLIVSDVMMPVMTGTEMCLKIKNNISLCHIPVVLLTALDTVDQKYRRATSWSRRLYHQAFQCKNLNNPLQ